MYKKAYSVSVDARGSIKIPKEVREHFSLDGAVELIIRDDGIFIPCRKDKGKREDFEWEYTQEPRLKSAYLY